MMVKRRRSDARHGLLTQSIIMMVAIFGYCSLVYLPKVSCDENSMGTCPSVCTCSQKMVDCSRKSLKSFPSSLPSATLILDLRGNEISSIKRDDITRLSNLQTLYLDGNTLTIFPAVGDLSSLQKLSITNNKIKVIPRGTLSRLESLQWLDLSHNEILAVPNGTFPVTPKFEYLDLSHNNITTVIDLLEVPMLNLTHLKLSYNKITALQCFHCYHYFTHKLDNFKNVRVLELDHNRITTATNFFFSSFPSVRKLYLSHNKFQTISVGVLHGAQKLEELYLNGNRLQFLTNMLYQRKDLKILDMSDNMLKGIVAAPFTHANCIERLNLAGNELKRLPPSCFSPLRKLKYLYLERNQISEISRTAFYGLQSLQTVNLSNNAISLGRSELDTAFMPMYHLKSLDLSGNAIILIPRNAFRGLHNLLFMNLSHNNVISVQSGAFSQLTSLKKMKLQAPKLICDCSVRWFRNWVKSHSFEDSVTGKCKGPIWLLNKSLYEVEDREFVCASKVNNSIKPEIIVHPKTQEVQRNLNVTLRCVATVLFPETPIFGLTVEDRKERTSMNIEWYFHAKNEKERLVLDKIIKTSPQEHIGRRVYRRMSELTLKHVDYTDVGRYRCHVRNFYGDEWSQRANLTVVVLPYFVKKPQDERVLSGVSVQISCSAKGSPVPIVKVSRKKGVPFPAVDEKRFWFENGKKSNKNGYKFGISNVKIGDSGEYICSASSRVGTINSSMVLTVIAPPRFVRSMKSKKVVIGSTAVFECIFTGNPKPKVEWFKNNTKIAKGKHGRLTVSDQLLIILDVRFEDAGTYSCRVSNTLGMKQQIAKLAVVTDASGITNKPPESNSMPVKLFIGILVITGISVTILTSVVWVALIFFCKGRRSRAVIKRTSNQPNAPQEQQDQDSDIQIHSDHFTVPPLLVNDGSGLVFGYGHLYPDNQRNITEREIIAHIRGDDFIAEEIPLIAARDSQTPSEARLVTPTSDSRRNEAQNGDTKNDVRKNDSDVRNDDISVEPSRKQFINPTTRFDSQTLHDRIKGKDPPGTNCSNDVHLDTKLASSPHKDFIYCSCPADISDGLFVKNITDTPQKRTNTPGRTSHKKRVPRRPSHVLLRRDIDGEEYYNNYNNASSSGVESGESSSSSDSVSITNFEVARAKSSSMLGAV